MSPPCKNTNGNMSPDKTGISMLTASTLKNTSTKPRPISQALTNNNPQIKEESKSEITPTPIARSKTSNDLFKKTKKPELPPIPSHHHSQTNLINYDSQPKSPRPSNRKLSQKMQTAMEWASKVMFKRVITTQTQINNSNKSPPTVTQTQTTQVKKTKFKKYKSKKGKGKGKDKGKGKGKAKTKISPISSKIRNGIDPIKETIHEETKDFENEFNRKSIEDYNNYQNERNISSSENERNRLNKLNNLSQLAIEAERDKFNESVETNQEEQNSPFSKEEEKKNDIFTTISKSEVNAIPKSKIVWKLFYTTQMEINWITYYESNLKWWARIFLYFAKLLLHLSFIGVIISEPMLDYNAEDEDYLDLFFAALGSFTVVIPIISFLSFLLNNQNQRSRIENTDISTEKSCGNRMKRICIFLKKLNRQKTALILGLILVLFSNIFCYCQGYFYGKEKCKKWAVSFSMALGLDCLIFQILKFIILLCMYKKHDFCDLSDTLYLKIFSGSVVKLEKKITKTIKFEEKRLEVIKGRKIDFYERNQPMMLKYDHPEAEINIYLRPQQKEITPAPHRQLSQIPNSSPLMIEYQPNRPNTGLN